MEKNGPRSEGGGAGCFTGVEQKVLSPTLLVFVFTPTDQAYNLEQCRRVSIIGKQAEKSFSHSDSAALGKNSLLRLYQRKLAEK